MFSLLVESNLTAWETDQLMRMDRSRFKEYSKGAEAQAVDLTKPETLRLLEQAPALLMYERATEGSSADVVRYGWLREIKVSNRELTFRFAEERRCPRALVYEFGDRLGIDRYEQDRTHWAIKDGAIPSAMMSRLRQVYDVVLSFAGENRPYVEEVASFLTSHGVKVFYDEFEGIDLWGKDMVAHFDYVYRQAARYCVVFISKFYAQKMWPKHERASALVRALQSDVEYVLPARFDDSELPGIRTTVNYVALRDRQPAQLGAMILEKLGRTKVGA